MSGTEQWQPGDVAFAPDLRLWRRASPPDPPWRQVGSVYYVSEDVPVRPLTLLVRDGKPVGARTCTCCSDDSGLDDARYDHLIDLCRRVVAAHDADDGGPVIAGSLLAELWRELNGPAELR